MGCRTAIWYRFRIGMSYTMKALILGGTVLSPLPELSVQSMSKNGGYHHRQNICRSYRVSGPGNSAKCLLRNPWMAPITEVFVVVTVCMDQ